MPNDVLIIKMGKYEATITPNIDPSKEKDDDFDDNGYVFTIWDTELRIKDDPVMGLIGVSELAYETPEYAKDDLVIVIHCLMSSE